MAAFRILYGSFTSIIGIIAFVWGIVALILAIIFLIPLLGWVNWLVIPFAAMGMLLSILAAANPDTRALGNVGISLGSTALGLSLLRLILGGGII